MYPTQLASLSGLSQAEHRSAERPSHLLIGISIIGFSSIRSNIACFRGSSGSAGVKKKAGILEKRRPVDRLSVAAKRSAPSPLRASHPSQGETFACSFRFPPLSPTEGFLGLTVRFICGNHEYALRIFVRHVEDLQEAAGRSLADLPTRVSGRAQVFAWSAQDFPNFSFSDPVPINL